MTHAELQQAVIDRWKASAPIDLEQARTLAKEVLSGHPKESADFMKWLDRFGADTLKRLGCA